MQEGGRPTIFNIALCDDDTAFNKQFRNKINKILEKKHIDFNFQSFTDLQSLAEALETGITYHLLFLDVLLGQDNGIDFARHLRENGNQIDLIFITSSRDYAVDSYDVHPIHYLIKPIEQSKLESALLLALEKNIPKQFLLQTANGFIHIPLSDILYFEIYNRTILLHKTNNETITFTGTLNNLENKLPMLHFVRVHKSYLANIKHIIKITRYELTLTNHMKIPIGKKRYTAVQKNLLEYAQQKNHGV
ncbi:LytTR family DNA-binding domain-containing protein [Sinanaerobacter sp. ZZT-01]|uniref:LytR/AlgR family response regulator transcription factor n=1 Tax=Sinanaerobacter sp. ZZT-01 TaxID=3111540 RepID=UPI002D787072|nr:LytTR family DNA-binding domain-containing protein [Sinanaerobacter sp. ZZT-01]WRR92814.1 LytTR family DNA-binding domain-containing protein [Sinanaerobacter sp. ZZT-01]